MNVGSENKTRTAHNCYILCSPTVSLYVDKFLYLVSIYLMSKLTIDEVTGNTFSVTRFLFPPLIADVGSHRSVVNQWMFLCNISMESTVYFL